MIFNPAADARIEAGDMLIAIGRAHSLAELGALARGMSASKVAGRKSKV